MEPLKIETPFPPFHSIHINSFINCEVYIFRKDLLCVLMPLFLIHTQKKTSFAVCLFAEEISSTHINKKVPYDAGAAIRIHLHLSLIANPQNAVANNTYCSHGLCFSLVHMKNTSYKTNQTDSLQMETKVQSQLRSDLIHCLSSDSMRSHPEIPHKPHLRSI